MSFTANDFNVVLSDSNGHFVRLEELNKMYALGVLKVDRKKLEAYKIATRIVTNKIETK